MPNNQNKIIAYKEITTQDIWVLAQHRESIIEESAFGLINEARRIRLELKTGSAITAVVLGTLSKDEHCRLGEAGADIILVLKDASLNHYHGEIFAKLLASRVNRDRPGWILAAQSRESDDLIPRLAAILESSVLTKALDCQVDREGNVSVVRPIANGYLSQKMSVIGKSPLIVSFTSAILSKPETVAIPKVELVTEEADRFEDDSETRFVQTVTTNPDNLELEEADIVVAGGRGVDKKSGFALIHELASSIGGSVGATRPVIDQQILPDAHQIGQTGKTISPRLIINCGISGAFEYTAGMEDSQLVIAIDKNPKARMFQFADVGVVGDINRVIPLLISRINEIKNS